jgi:iron complex outermembrane receptor protein
MNQKYLSPWVAVSVAAALSPISHAADDTPVSMQVLDEVSVTATREERATQDVPQSITVISEQKIESTKMQNVKDALIGVPGVLIDSKNGGYDARLIVRGAGLKAAYGIRELMLLRDGVPMTDPDSFTRLDFIDTQDIERIEVSRGPGDLYSTGSAGGAIHIISRSVFEQNDRIRLGIGSYGMESYHARVGGKVSDNQAVSLSASHRSSDNDWRAWNEFDTSQLSLKHGAELAGGGLWESELSYSEANLQLPGSMDAAQFETFTSTGEQTATQDPWKHSGRYSNIWFFNTRYEQELGAVTFKPRFYYTQWTHYHPVTGLINDTEDWVQTYGTDLESNYRHRLGENDARLVAGVTLRRDVNDDSRKYEYRDVVTGTGGRILSTLSDTKGALASVQSADNLLYGVFMQESVHAGDRAIVDVGFRLDRSRFDIDENELRKFNYATGTYAAGDGLSSIGKSYTLFAPKIGVTYRLTPTISTYGLVAQADQVPSESEIMSNPDLRAPRTRNYEIGLKARSGSWSFDTAVYVSPVRDEIIQVRQDAETVYQNAGKTDKKGVELSGGYQFTPALQAGVNYAYSDYRYDEFTEVVRTGMTVSNIDRAGNRLPYVPMHQYGAYVNYRHPAGFRVVMQSNNWGEYYLDNANTEKYAGYDWVTNIGLGYDRRGHSIMLNIDNAFDDLYATEVKKDTNGKVSYYAAMPRTYMLNYRYAF